MKLKLILLIAGAAVLGNSITIIIVQSNERAKRREMERRPTENADHFQSAFSNYNKTFTLNTIPPLWPVDGTKEVSQNKNE